MSKINAKMNKKGLELSINFIVIVVISLIVFFFGARFIYQLGAEATQLQSITADELEKRIGELACGGSERVCFPSDKKIIKKGKLGIFGMRIINVLEGDSHDFSLSVTQPDPPGYTEEGDEIFSGEDELPQFKYREEPFPISKNKEADRAIGVEIPSSAKSGTYILDVAVCYNDGDSNTRDNTGKCGEDIYSYNKIYVEVP